MSYAHLSAQQRSVLCAISSSSRAGISRGETENLNNIFRNNLHGGVLCGTEHWHFKSLSTSAFARADSQVSLSWQRQRRVTLITPASDCNHPGCHLDAESGPGSGIRHCTERDCTAPECYLDTERFLFTDRLHGLDRKPGAEHS